MFVITQGFGGAMLITQGYASGAVVIAALGRFDTAARAERFPAEPSAERFTSVTRTERLTAKPL